MESAQTHRAENTPKTTHAAPDVAVKSDQKADSGAVTGMPMFLQRSVANTVPAIQRQTDKLEEIPEETFAEEDIVQAKLVVNEPGDIYEQEADRVAEVVSSSFSKESPVDSLNLDQQIQRQSTTPAAAASPSGLATADSGQPLSTNVRQQIEPVLGADLTDVRVHSKPSDQALAASLQAKAFTHDRHIWLGENQTSDDVSLMAHETTHVVQQTAGGNSIQRIQRKLADNQHPEDVAEPRRRMEKRIEDAQKEATENPPKIDEENAPTSLDEIDRSEISQQKNAVAPDAALVVNRPAQEGPPIEQAGNAAQSKAEEPSEPIAVGGSETATGEKESGEGAGSGEGVQESANQAAGLAGQLFGQASSQTVDSPPNMTQLQPIAPVDAAGQLLPVNPAADTQMVGLIDQAQSLRDQGQALHQGAAEQRSNAITIRGNILLAKGSINEVNANLESAQGDLAYRREVLGQANEALVVSEQKAETVAEHAPEHQAKADEGRSDSEPMASEVAEMSSETAANTPDDDEAAGKAQEQGQKVGQVNSDTQTTDDAFARSQSKAQSLSEKAEVAKATNEQTQEQLTGVDATLAGTDDKLAEFSTQNTVTRAHFDNLETQPNSLIAQADTLDQQGQSLIQASQELKTQIHQAQADYEAGMASVPASTASTEAAGAETVIQRTPTRPGERVNLHIDEWAQRNLGGWLGYDAITEEKRQEQFAESERRRASQIQAITDRYGANLERASAWDKVLMGASLAGDNLFHSAANASWPKFFGHFVQGLVDPRIGLQGIVSGLNMTLSGAANAANLFTGEDLTWENAIKSTAEIVTGITYLLGSITLVATAIAVILTAIAVIGSLFSFGAVGAALAPFITFFWSTVTTVGGWTILWAKFALLVQFIAGIKDLIDAAAATTATDLQGQSQQMSDDATQMAGAAAIIGLAKLGEIGGRTAIGQQAANGINGFLRARDIPSPFRAAAQPQELPPPVEPVEPVEPGATGGRQSERVPGLSESIDPAVPPDGYQFSDTVSTRSGEIVVDTTVTAPDGSSGSMSRGLNPTTGELIYHHAFLDSIPRVLRWVKTGPAMVPGRGTPLETYMTMRQMRLLEQQAGGSGSGSGLFFGTPRSVHLSTIINIRTVAQLAVAERAGLSLNEGILNTHSVQYANNPIVQGGGRITGARVSGGYRTSAIKELTPTALENNGLSRNFLQENGIPPDYEVLTGFEIDLTVVPAGSANGGGTPPSLVIPPPLGTDTERRDK